MKRIVNTKLCLALAACVVASSAIVLVALFWERDWADSRETDRSGADAIASDPDKSMALEDVSITGSKGVSRETTDPEPDPPRFSRPEDVGAQPVTAATVELIEGLDWSADRIDQRKFARELGNRAIAGRLILTPKQQEAANEYVRRLLPLTVHEDANTRSEARTQVARLWHVAVPVCLDAVTDLENGKARELARKSLILMRNREIIEQLIKKGRDTDDPKKRYCIHWVLKGMDGQRTTTVPNRNVWEKRKVSSFTASL